MASDQNERRRSRGRRDRQLQTPAADLETNAPAPVVHIERRPIDDLAAWRKLVAILRDLVFPPTNPEP